MTDLIIDSIVEDDERIIFNVSTRESLIDIGRTFTRSDGTVVARLYERLTKASRRRAARHDSYPYTVEFFQTLTTSETAYRKGVYDGFKALQEELNYLV